MNRSTWKAPSGERGTGSGARTASPSARRGKVVAAGARLAAKAEAERSARRRRLGRRGIVALAVAGPLVLLGWLLLFSPVLAVRTVTVSGTRFLTASQVVAAAAVYPGTPLARVDDAALTRRIERLPAVADVQISRGWPSTLRVHVIERVPVAAVESATGVTLVDAQGVLFTPAPALPPGLVRLQVTQPGPHDPSTRAALAVLAELPSTMRQRLLILRAVSPASVTLLLRDGRQVLWGGAGDATVKTQAAEALLAMPGTVYDVSRPDVVTRR